jgi:hypothetical protein
MRSQPFKASPIAEDYYSIVQALLDTTNRKDQPRRLQLQRRFNECPLEVKPPKNKWAVGIKIKTPP